ITTNSPPSRRNSACRRETVTSSRKMSLSGCRPALVVSWSSRNRDPAFGPRLTTSSADPPGSASTPATEDSGGLSWSSGSARKSARKTEVCSGVRSGVRSGGVPGPSFVLTWAPQGTGVDRRTTYRAGTGPRVPAVGPVPAAVRRLLLDELPVAAGVQQGLQRARIGQPDLDHQSIPVRVGVDQLRRRVELAVAGHHLPREWHEDVRDALRGLDLAHRVSGRDRLPHLGQPNEHHVPHLLLGVVRNSDPDGVRARSLHPLV